MGSMRSSIRDWTSPAKATPIAIRGWRGRTAHRTGVVINGSGFDAYLPRPATTLMVAAMMTVPKR